MLIFANLFVLFNPELYISWCESFVLYPELMRVFRVSLIFWHFLFVSISSVTCSVFQSPALSLIVYMCTVLQEDCCSDLHLFSAVLV